MFGLRIFHVGSEGMLKKTVAVRVVLCFAGMAHGMTVSHYSIVWNSPSQNESGSMPIGNGVAVKSTNYLKSFNG